MVPRINPELGDVIYVGVLPHKGSEGEDLEEAAFSIKLEDEGVLFLRKELSTVGDDKSYVFAGEAFHQILRDRRIRPENVYIVAGGRTSSDTLNLVDCRNPSEKDLNAFLECLESPGFANVRPVYGRNDRPETVQSPWAAKDIGIYLGILFHEAADIRERCYALYSKGKFCQQKTGNDATHNTIPPRFEGSFHSQEGLSIRA